VQVIKHHFIGPRLYIREIRLEEGEEICQHAHNYDHTSYLSEGEVLFGDDYYVAPAEIHVPAGVEHAVAALVGPVHWTCCHLIQDTTLFNENNIDEVLIKHA